MSDDKVLVQQVVDRVINGGDLAAVDELFSPEIADAARDWVAPFRQSFPDVVMTTVELVAEGGTVVGHFRCSGTQAADWQGRPSAGGSFRDVREVYWFHVRDGRVVDWWGLEDDEDRRRQLRESRTRG